MKPQGTGLVSLHDDKETERGFGCMMLIGFLTGAGVTEWERWHGAHIQAAAGQCPYTEQCPVYARTRSRNQKINQSPQLSLFDDLMD